MTPAYPGVTIQDSSDRAARLPANGRIMKRRGLITFLILALAVFAGLAFYGDLPEVLGKISSLPAAYWLAAFGLALANYLFRLARWQYYLKLVGVNIGIGASAAIFLSGLSMVISPGRLGELAKSYYLREKRGVPVSRSASAVVAERVTDLVAVLLLSLWGLTLVPYGWALAIFILAAFGLFILFAVSPWGSDRLLRLPLPQRWKPFLTTTRDALQQVFSVKPLAIALVLSTLAWFAEGCALWLILKGLGTTGGLGEAMSIYAVATLLGAVTMLPGGLGGTEGGMVALLQQLDLTKTQATAATFIIRICTLWFAVAIGLVALAYVHFAMPRKASESVGPFNSNYET